MAKRLRKTGIPIIGDATEAFHLCVLFESFDELIAALAPYFSAGLAQDEVCLWVAPEGVSSGDARKALVEAGVQRAEVSSRRIVIEPYEEWFSGGVAQAMRRWDLWADRTLSDKLLGRVVSSPPCDGSPADWDLEVYGPLFAAWLERRGILGVCAFALPTCTGRTAVDIIKAHRFTMFRRAGEWNVLENYCQSRRGSMIEQLSRSLDFFAKVFEDLPNPVMRTDTDGKAVYFNKAWLGLVGRPIETQLGDGWSAEIHPDDLVRIFKDLIDATRGRSPTSNEFRVRRRDGVYRWVSAYAQPFDDPDGRFAGYIGVMFDVTDRRRHEQTLAFQAAHDPLTGTANRRALEEAVERAIARARRGAASVFLLMDLDRFKEINDTFGHDIGDRALIAVSGFLMDHLRAGDILGRLGGDEFGVLLEGVDTEEANRLAERMCRQLEDYKERIDERVFQLGLSVGLVPVTGDEDLPLLLAMADHAMYRAKSGGGGRVAVHR